MLYVVIKIQQFIKKQEANGLLNNLGIRALLSKILILRDILFGMQFHWVQLYNINDIINKLLLARDKFMSEMHLRQPQFTYSACGPSSKNKERIQKTKKTGGTKYIYRNELDKVYFQHDMVIEILKI